MVSICLHLHWNRTGWNHIQKVKEGRTLIWWPRFNLQWTYCFWDTVHHQLLPSLWKILLSFLVLLSVLILPCLASILFYPWFQSHKRKIVWKWTELVSLSLFFYFYYLLLLLLSVALLLTTSKRWILFRIASSVVSFSFYSFFSFLDNLIHRC